MKSNSYPELADLSEASAIIGAVRQLHGSAQLRDEAASNPAAVLDRFALTGAARHAVAASLAAMLAGSALSWPPWTDFYWA